MLEAILWEKNLLDACFSRRSVPLERCRSLVVPRFRVLGVATNPPIPTARTLQATVPVPTTVVEETAVTEEAAHQGGVARNIAENLGKLGMDTTLLTVSGTDPEWNYIAEQSSPSMNLEDVTHFSKATTGSYTAVLDDDGDLVVGLADMDIFDLMTPEWIQQHVSLLQQAKCILADLNCPKDTLQFLCKFAKSHDLALILVAVSAPKMKHIPDKLDGLSWMITNLDESEAYFHCELTPAEAVEKWLDLGIENVVITKGKEGAVVGNKVEGISHVTAIETSEIIDVTGAGDAFSSAITYAWLEGKSLIDTTKAGIVNATKTLQTAYTVRRDLSAIQLQEDMEELL